MDIGITDDKDATRDLVRNFTVVCDNCGSLDIIVQIEHTVYETSFFLTCTVCKKYIQVGQVARDYTQD